MVFRSTRLTIALAVALAITSVGSTAGLSSPAPKFEIAQSSGSGTSKPTSTKPSSSGVNLTQEQIVQLSKIRQDERQQIIAVLTPDQKTKLTTATKSGKRMNDVLKTLNLTADQQKKIQGIRQSTSQRYKQILTPEQLKKLQGMEGSR
jgi:Spy/CpxP family protein refolding chaperone